MYFKLTGISFFILFAVNQLQGQSYNHWTRSFNEESSLLSGAVVGGGAGPSAIYYNPASISEITESKLSFHASLFSYNFFNIKNALGDGIEMKWSTLQIEPRFLSFMVQPKNYPNWSIEFAFLNNENYRLDMARSVDMNIDILKQIPGPDRYFAALQYRNNFRDDWLGVGMSWKLSPQLFLGASMFVTIKALEYNYNLDLEAYPIDTIGVINPTDYYSANYQEMEYIKYNDYRLLWKIGILYKRERFSVGASVTTPSLGGIYSDGKRVSRRVRQSGITDPDTGNPLPDYFIGDFKEKKDMQVNHKSPFSVAAGFTLHSPGRSRILYTTAEYFGGLDAFKVVEADESNNISTSTVLGAVDLNEWLTLLSGANPVINAAIGYQWTINEELLLMAGFRTDFNYLKGFDMGSVAAKKYLKGIGVDNYHFSGGLSYNILGQDIITGIQYTLGVEKNREQFINLSDPVEYNHVEEAPLQGTRQDNMHTLINSLSLYLGATFNFGVK